MEYKEKIRNLYNKVRFSALLEDSLLAKKLEEAFPELKEETEDDIVIKALKSGIRLLEEEYHLKGLGGIKFKKILSWLEKQGNKNSQVILPTFTFDDILALQCCMETVKKVQMDKDLYEKLNDLHGRVYDAYHLEKQDEPVDKVKPKFKVGDWIMCYYNSNCANSLMKIVKVGLTDYLCRYDDGQSTYNCDYIDNAYHLWTIQDAKDGDILVCGEDKRPFIFKGLLDKFHPDSPVAYCGIDCGNEFFITAGINWWTDDIVQPATKEQRDQLEKAMADAGYRWDAEKKELRKIEDKPLVIDEGKDEIDRNFTEMMLKDYTEQKSAWSEDDERKLGESISLIKSNNTGTFYYEKNELISFLKSLKDRVQPKAELIQLDDYNPYKEVVESIAEMCKHYDKGDLQDFYDNVKVKCKDAKEYDSLYPWNRWKPSEEQMKALDIALKTGIQIGTWEEEALKSLKEQLKKLRGE